MGKYLSSRVDAKAAELYEFMEAHGVTVQRIGRPLDALVAVDGATALAEVKSATGKLRTSQAKFLERWPGVVKVLRTEADCLALIRILRRMAHT